jgi:hypothetical protein
VELIGEQYGPFRTRRQGVLGFGKTTPWPKNRLLRCAQFSGKIGLADFPSFPVRRGNRPASWRVALFLGLGFSEAADANRQPRAANSARSRFASNPRPLNSMIRIAIAEAAFEAIAATLPLGSVGYVKRLALTAAGRAIIG